MRFLGSQLTFVRHFPYRSCYECSANRSAGETSQLNWIIAAFNLTSAAFIPFWGQIADIFGRHTSLQTCLVLMLIGSALCTGAPTSAYAVLLLGRAFQGLACAGLNVLVRICIADRVTLRENAKNWSIFSFFGGVIGWGLGPLIGGQITSKSHWRWCFGLNLPIAFASMLIIYFVLRSELLGPQPIPQLDETTETGRRTTFAKRLQTIDVGGQFLFLFGFGLLILGLSWAGATYAWDSAAVLGTLILGFIISILFIVYEYHMAPGKFLARHFPSQKAMIPWELVRTRDIGLLFYTSFATGMAMYSVLYFCNIYFTMVKLWSADQAGTQLLYFTPGLGVGVYVSAFMCNSWPRKTFPPIFLGSILEMVGIGLIAWAISTEHDPTVYGMMALTGVGTGLRVMPVPLHGIGHFPKKIAAVVSLMAVAYPFGGTVGLTILTTVYNNVSGISNDSPLRDFTTLKNLPAAEQAAVTHDAKMGIVWAYVAICPFMVIVSKIVSQDTVRNDSNMSFSSAQLLPHSWATSTFPGPRVRGKMPSTEGCICSSLSARMPIKRSRPQSTIRVMSVFRSSCMRRLTVHDVGTFYDFSLSEYLELGVTIPDWKVASKQRNRSELGIRG